MNVKGEFMMLAGIVLNTIGHILDIEFQTIAGSFMIGLGAYMIAKDWIKR